MPKGQGCIRTQEIGNEGGGAVSFQTPVVRGHQLSGWIWLWTPGEWWGILGTTASQPIARRHKAEESSGKNIGQESLASRDLPKIRGKLTACDRSGER